MNRSHLITLILIISCTAPSRIDYHRKTLHMDRLKKPYRFILDQYYSGFLIIDSLPDSVAADRAAMVTRDALMYLGKNIENVYLQK